MASPEPDPPVSTSSLHGPSGTTPGPRVLSFKGISRRSQEQEACCNALVPSSSSVMPPFGGSTFLLSVRELKLTTEILDFFNLSLIQQFYSSSSSLRNARPFLSSKQESAQSQLSMFLRQPYPDSTISHSTTPCAALTCSGTGNTSLRMRATTNQGTGSALHLSVQPSGAGQLSTANGEEMVELLLHSVLSRYGSQKHISHSACHSRGILRGSFRPPDLSPFLMKLFLTPDLQLLKTNHMLFSSLLRHPLQVTLVAQSSPAATGGSLLLRLGCPAMPSMLSDEQKCLLHAQPSLTSFLDLTHSLLEKVQRKYRLSRKPQLILKYIAPECSTQTEKPQEGCDCLDSPPLAPNPQPAAVGDSTEVLSHLNHSMTSALAQEVTLLLSAKLNSSAPLPTTSSERRLLQDFRNHLSQQQPADPKAEQGDGPPPEESPHQASTFTHTFLQSVMASVDCRDPVVANAWMETLLDVIDLLPLDIIHRNILRLAVGRGQLSQPVSSRILCCRLLGKLCTKFQPYVIKKEIVPMVQCLCQDVNPDVRATMCSQLDLVARGIGLESSRSAVLPELVELAQDEAAGVRRAAVRALAAMAPLLSHEDGRSTLAPLLRKCCAQALTALDPLVLPCLARALGTLCRALADCLSAAQQVWFLQYYCQLARLGVSQPLRISSMPDLVPRAEKSDICLECRVACAFNMPAMVQFAGPSLFSDYLAGLFGELCADPHPQVRAMMAAGFQEVQSYAGGANLLRELLSLLRDSSLQVVQSGLLEHLTHCVEAVPWAALSATEKKETAGDLLQALLACEATLASSYKWRLHAQLLSQMASLPQRLPASVLQPVLGPFLMNRVLTLRPLPCRLAAGYSLLMLLRSCPTLSQREALVARIDAELCRGQSCHHRMLYVRLCELATQIFSWNFFRTHFFSPLLSLAADNVANIRLRLCSLLAPLKACMQLPADSQLLAALEACVRRLMAVERDHDVMAALCHAIEELDQIEVPIMTTPDLEDLNRQREEEAFLVAEEDKKLRSRKAIRGVGGHNSLPRPSPKIPVASKKYGTIPRTKQEDSNNKSGIPRVGGSKKETAPRNVLRRASTPPPPSNVSKIPSLRRKSMIGN